MNDKCSKCKSKQHLDIEITMAFQPIVDLNVFKIYAYEALVRGVNGEGAVEVFKHVNKDNLYLFDQSCRKKAIEIASKLKLQNYLSINFMPNAVYEPSRCIQSTLQSAKQYNFPLDLIIFEFTEQEQLVDTEHVVSIVMDYQKRGFLTAIDDFGAGYSGLNLLSYASVDVVKIDRKMIRDIDSDPRRIRLMRGLLEMLTPIVKRIVIEGVENEEELKCLYNMGYRHFQGFYFAKPGFESLPSVDFATIREVLEVKR